MNCGIRSIPGDSKMSEKKLTWLPDERATVQVENKTGLVHPVSPETFFSDVAGAMEGGDAFSGMHAAGQELGARIASGEAQEWRGLIAACLLSDLLLSECTFHAVSISSGSGRLSRSVLQVLGTDLIQVYVLEKNAERIPLGILDHDLLIVPAKSIPPLGETLQLQERIAWYDGEKFGDPVPYLTPLQRSVLIQRLHASNGGVYVQRFADELEALEGAIAEEATGKDRKNWEKTVKCVLGLYGESGFEELTAEIKEPIVSGGNTLLKELSQEDPVRSTPSETLWKWKGIPLAWESHVILAERLRDAQAEAALEELSLDEDILEKCVSTYADSLKEKLEDVLRAHSFQEQVVSSVQGWCESIAQFAARQAGNLSLTYPWRTTSPALASLLQDTLGASLGSAAMEPFSDRLLLMSGASMDDSMLERMCTVSWEGGSSMILPPLSRSMAQWESEHRSEYGYVPDSLKAQMDASGRITISYLIQGEKGNITVSRTYTSMEQVMMRPEQIPVVSLWPSVPLPNELWKAYYISVRGRVCAEVYAGLWHSAASDDTEEGALGKCAVVKTESFPYVILLSRNGLTLGTLMYAPDMYTPASSGEAIAALDLGESGTSVAWTTEEGIHELNIPSLLHVLLRGSRWDPSGEKLPGFPVSSVVESAVVLDDTAGNVPFEDGYICVVQGMQVLHPCCHFLWRSDKEGARALQILIRQLLLMTSFDLVMHGASSVTWHVCVPYAMGLEERRRMQKEIEHAAQDVQEICGFQVRDVYALWQDLRCAGQFLYSRFNHASFLMMDCGGGDSSIALWLRGMPQPVLEMEAGDGLAMQLHSAFLNIPMTAAADLQMYPWMRVAEFSDQLIHARDSVEAWEESRRQVDALLGEHLTETIDMLSFASQSNCANYTQALMLLEMAKRMVLCGLALECVGNESTLSDKLPSNLPVILCGRGGNVFLSLPSHLQAAMMHFAQLPLRRNHPVTKIHMESSTAPKMEAAYGLLLQTSQNMLRARMTELRGTVPLDWLLGHFLMLFFAMFPQPSSLLFPGSCLPNGMLSDSYANMILPLAAAWQTEKMGDALSGCLERLRAWPRTDLTVIYPSTDGQNMPMDGGYTT